jgi:hypothetical protein
MSNDAAEQPLDLAPFDMLTQKEQWAHLSQYHKTWQLSHGLNSKSRKDDMERAHRRSHMNDVGMGSAHTHTAVAALNQPPGDDVSGSDLTGSDLSRPLNTTQRRALKDLVENDFLTMRAEIEQMAADMAQQRRVELTREWAERGADADAFERRGAELMTTYRKDAAALIAEARIAGVDLSMPNIKDSYPSLEAKVTGLNETIRAAENEVDADRRRALNTLERQRLTAQRKVLLTGVTEEALAVLDTIPTAQALMLEAAAQRVERAAVTG